MGVDLMKRVLACIDESAAARPVIEVACAIAPLFDATVEAVHVAEDHEATPSETARSQHVPLRMLHGDVVDELTTLIASEDVAAVAVGARGRTTHRLVGHVALELAERSDTPVLVVPPDAHVARIHRVLVALKGTPSNAIHLARALELAADADIDLVVVHVDDESTIPSFSDQAQYETDEYAREFMARYVPAAPLARLKMRVGAPAEEILHASDEVHPDMIAVGWRKHGGERGEVARELLERSHLPLLLVAVR
jgi:nucleotide-binding universal stress UspA family protein